MEGGKRIGGRGSQAEQSLLKTHRYRNQKAPSKQCFDWRSHYGDLKSKASPTAAGKNAEVGFPRRSLGGAASGCGAVPLRCLISKDLSLFPNRFVSEPV